MRARVSDPGVESGLSASLDETNSATVAGAGTFADPEASSNHETPKETDVPSSCVSDPEGVLVSMYSTLDWEAVTTPDATFLGIALVASATPAGVEVPGVTYSG